MRNIPLNLLTFSFLLACSLFSLHGSALAQQHCCNVDIFVDEFKPNGKPWDGFGGKPDIFLRIINTGQTMECEKNNLVCGGGPFDMPSPHWKIEITDMDAAADDLIGSGFCQTNVSECRLGSAKILFSRY